MNWTIFLLALASVESGGDPLAVGDSGKAIGIYQLHEVYIDDVNRIYGTSYEWPSDARNSETAQDIVIKYLSYWGERREVMFDPTALARIHNGGPQGHTKRSTIKYGGKFSKAYLDRAKNDRS